MASGETFGTDSNVGSTIALLETRLPGVRERRRQLEDELAAVVAQENAMVSVLQGLTALSGASLNDDSSGGQGAAAAEPVQGAAPSAAGAAAGLVDEEAASWSEPEPAAAPAVRKRPAKRTAEGTGVAKKSSAEKTTAKKAVAKKTAPAKKVATKKTVAPADKPAPMEEVPTTAAPGAASGSRRRLTDAKSVLAVLAGVTTPLRAREVTGLLGLDDQDANVNAIRTMLERLARTGKAQRSGRGLYVAVVG
ncbi:hypothetical protein KNE206_57520 [Kitasatospora sp. NE20-6]|uniref:hypothetical protein n=1 Tax=Kitasatospora sp. NE20-6 TaxID=2859066 RepID=UPI0034DC1432